MCPGGPCRAGRRAARTGGGEGRGRHRRAGREEWAGGKTLLDTISYNSCDGQKPLKSLENSTLEIFLRDLDRVP